MTTSTGLRDRAERRIAKWQHGTVFDGATVFTSDDADLIRALLASPAPAGAEGWASSLEKLARLATAEITTEDDRRNWKFLAPQVALKLCAALASWPTAATPPAEARELVEDVKARADEVSASWDRVTGTIDLDEVELLLRAVAALSPASAKTAEDRDGK